MNSPNSETLDLRIESYIDSFEERLAEQGTANVAEFFPDRNDPLFSRVASELVRVDLELAWDAGTQKTLADYVELLPELNSDPQLRSEIAFEEYRQRCHHGETVMLEDFAAKYDVATTGWSTVVASKDKTTTAADFDKLAEQVPSSGQRWRDFEIIEEIGRGALSRVMLAKQTSLSGRPVVLKFAPKHLLEAEKLARLQHSNIVPVFSVYEDRDFHVFCMPYLGDQTLLQANEQKTASSTDLETRTLEIFGKLASAIEHAHERGILHNDIKPANVLWADDQPMLLDFNLAANASRTEEVQIGGTLPYMSPESLHGLLTGEHRADERSDIFSLGALMFELSTGEYPFSKQSTIQETLANRSQPRSELLAQSKVSPSFVAIINKCLRSDPAERYQSAAELLTDIELQRTHFPLQHAENASWKDRLNKWTRRHPRLASTTSLGIITATLLVVGLTAWFARERYVRDLEAKNAFASFVEARDRVVPELSSVGSDFVDADAAIDSAERMLSTYVRNGEWRSNELYKCLSPHEQHVVDDNISQVAFLTSSVYLRSNDDGRLQKAKRWSSVSAFGAETRSGLLLSRRLRELSDGAQTTGGAKANSLQLEPTTPGDMLMTGVYARHYGNSADAKKILLAASEQAPDDYATWYNLAYAHMDLQEWELAANRFTTCLALQPDSAMSRFGRALARQSSGDSVGAIADLSTLLEFAIPQVEGRMRNYALFYRAISYKDVGEHQLALKDLNSAIDQGLRGSRPLIVRSRVKGLLGNVAGRDADLKAGIAATPQDEFDWIARGFAKMSKQPDEAMKDFEQALKLNPRSRIARQNMIPLLSGPSKNPNDAILVLDEVIKDYPLDADAFADRGVLLARAERYKEAIQDAKQVVALDGGPRAMLQAACVYSMASRKKPELQKVAVLLLGVSFKDRPSLVKLAVGDKDLKDIHEYDAFQDLCEAAKKFDAIPSADRAVEDTGL